MASKNRDIIDVGGSVRDGEALDIAAVTTWLIAQGLALKGDAKVTQYSGGASNWTYRLEYASEVDGEHYDLVLRRPPAGTKAKSAHDMVREYTVQRALGAKGIPVPKMIGLCTDQSVLGCDFYVMERIEGIIPRSNLPKELNFGEAEVRELCTNVIDELVKIHQCDYTDTPLTELGKGKGYCERQVMGWDSRYKKAKTLNVPSFYWVRTWLKRNIPEDVKTCVIHNDWRFDNVILSPENPTEVIGILDWEMATLGDPLMDLGSALAYWVQPGDNRVVRQMRRQPTHLKGMFTRDEVVAYYLDKMGLEIDNWTFYDVFGLFRLAGIIQQIYYRYYNKQTDNPAFKNFWVLVNVIHAMCLKRIALYEIGKFKISN